MKAILLKIIDTPWFGHGMSLLTSCLILVLAYAMRGDQGVHDMLVFLAGGSGGAGAATTMMRSKGKTSSTPPPPPSSN